MSGWRKYWHTVLVVNNQSVNGTSLPVICNTQQNIETVKQYSSTENVWMQIME